MSKLVSELAGYIRGEWASEPSNKNQWFGTPMAWFASLGLETLIDEVGSCCVDSRVAEDLDTICNYLRELWRGEVNDDRTRFATVLSALTHTGASINQARARMEVTDMAIQAEMAIGIKLSCFKNPSSINQSTYVLARPLP